MLDMNSVKFGTCIMKKRGSLISEGVILDRMHKYEVIWLVFEKTFPESFYMIKKLYEPKELEMFDLSCNPRFCRMEYLFGILKKYGELTFLGYNKPYTGKYSDTSTIFFKTEHNSFLQIIVSNPIDSDIRDEPLLWINESDELKNLYFNPGYYYFDKPIKVKLENVDDKSLGVFFVSADNQDALCLLSTNKERAFRNRYINGFLGYLETSCKAREMHDFLSAFN